MSGGIQLLSPSKQAEFFAMSSSAGNGGCASRKRRAQDMFSPASIDRGGGDESDETDENAGGGVDIAEAMRNMAKRQRRVG